MNDIFKKVAESQNVSEDEVKNEISKAIRLAMKSDDPIAREFWDKIAPNSEELSTEEVIEKIAFFIRKFYI